MFGVHLEDLELEPSKGRFYDMMRTINSIHYLHSSTLDQAGRRGHGFMT